MDDRKQCLSEEGPEVRSLRLTSPGWASLASIRRFAAALKALDEELDRRRQDAIPAEIETQIYGESKVRKLLTEMRAETPDASVLALVELSEDELARKASRRNSGG